MIAKGSGLAGFGLLLGTFLSSQAALAQTPPPPAAPATDARTTSQGGIVEILVTARKRVERAQDIPVSLSVATGEMLSNRSVVQLIDVQRQTPSLHIKPSALSGTATIISMRGQALQDIRRNVDPAVAIYVDGVVLPRAIGSNASDLVDIDRVGCWQGRRVHSTARTPRAARCRSARNRRPIVWKVSSRRVTAILATMASRG